MSSGNVRTETIKWSNQVARKVKIKFVRGACNSRTLLRTLGLFIGSRFTYGKTHICHNGQGQQNSITKCNQPLNNTGLNCMGPPIHGFFFFLNQASAVFLICGWESVDAEDWLQFYTDFQLQGGREVGAKYNFFLLGFQY